MLEEACLVDLQYGCFVHSTWPAPLYYVLPYPRYKYEFIPVLTADSFWEASNVRF